MTLIEDTVIFLAAAVVTVPLVQRRGYGSVLGYLAAGVLIGPSLLGVISDVEAILHFAELGVVMLLFIVGLELHPARLWSLRRPIFGLGFAQLSVSAVFIGLATYALGFGILTAIVVGLMLALSSTAVAIQTLAERRELQTQYGRASFSILLFQDLAVIPLLAVIPWLGSVESIEEAADTSVVSNVDWGAIFFSILVVAAVIVGGRYLLRPLLRRVAASGVNELFTAAALLVVLGMAWLLDWLGLSMALGAFLAGVLLADSEYRHRLEADIEPFKGLLLGLFFIAVGMSVDLQLILEQPVFVIGAALGLTLIKAAVLFPLGLVSRIRLRSAISLAALLPQGGEFAFVLLTVALSVGVIDRGPAELLILIVAISMALTPTTVKIGAFLNNRLERKRSKSMAYVVPEVEDAQSHVIIAGFGRFGQIVGRVLNVRKIRFVALDTDAERIAVARRFGNEAYFGDANRLQVLEAAGMEEATALVIAVDDQDRAVEMAQIVKMHFPNVPIFARARDRFHAYRLMDAGVDHVYREMFGSSLDLSEDLLHSLGMPSRQAAEITRRFYDHDQNLMVEQQQGQRDEEALRTSSQAQAQHLQELFVRDLEALDMTEKDSPVPVVNSTSE